MSRRKGQRPGQCVPRHAPTAVGGDKMVAGGGTRKGHRRGRSDGKHTFVGLRCTTHLRSVAAGSDGGYVLHLLVRPLLSSGATEEREIR
ncbi:hypothetical protein MTP99_009068 [Tenebrio molitor]|nr:hypothetical protein MTP99_009068 [Tenebrio molitor]